MPSLGRFRKKYIGNWVFLGWCFGWLNNETDISLVLSFLLPVYALPYRLRHWYTTCQQKTHECLISLYSVDFFIFFISFWFFFLFQIVFLQKRYPLSFSIDSVLLIALFQFQLLSFSLWFQLPEINIHCSLSFHFLSAFA